MAWRKLSRKVHLSPAAIGFSDAFLDFGALNSIAAKAKVIAFLFADSYVALINYSR